MDTSTLRRPDPPAPEPPDTAPPAPAPPAPAAPHVSAARLAAAAHRLSECRSLLEQLRDLADSLGGTRLTAVVGEVHVARKLAGVVEQADHQLAVLAAGPPEGDAHGLAHLEELLDQPLWAVAQQVHENLLERRRNIEEYVQLLKEQYRALRLNFDHLQRLVEKADLVRLADAENERTLAVEGIGKFRASEADFQAGRYDSVAVAVQHALTLLSDQGLTAGEGPERAVDPQRFDSYITSFEARIAQAETTERRLARRAELFLISGGDVNQGVPYKVLLRRPGYESIQETNLYDDVEVLVADQDLFKGTVRRIAEGAVQGIRSAMAAAAGGAQAQADDAGESPVRRAVPAARAQYEHLDQLDPATRLEKIGRRMYSLLIPDAMQRLIDETSPLPLTITSNNPELPWELLHDGNNFLCLKRVFARMPAGQTFPRRTREPLGGSRREGSRVLVIRSVYGEPLEQADREIEAIEERLASMKPAPHVTRLCTEDEVTSSRLTDELSLGNYDLIHYVGHAWYNPEKPDQSYLLLANGERFSAARVQRLLEGHPVVFLNACETSMSASPQPGQSTGSTIARAQGLASAFVYGGAQACVGALWPVFDDTAAQLAVRFYSELIEKRQRVGEALRRAREEVRTSQQDGITWAAYALYGDPSYYLGASTITAWGIV
ncbi:hypothetical protein GCM10028789_28900 [Sinomonas halotolerans]